MPPKKKGKSPKKIPRGLITLQQNYHQHQNMWRLQMIEVLLKTNTPSGTRVT
jgi:hypothetical protein